MEMTPKTYSIRELLALRRNSMLTVNPEYQRGAVWKAPQKKRLIDSVLRGYPIPLIYIHYIKKQVAEMQSESFEVIDGQQRMNSMYEFHEGNFKLFDPLEDEADARFPNFIKEEPCAWGRKDFPSLDTVLQEQFLETKLSVVRVTATPNEARDLFIRLQAGMPLNAQEKRDAWPGSFTEYILKIGGKPEIPRYPGHEFFKLIQGPKTGEGRGKSRQLAAQLAMLFLRRKESAGERLCNLNARSVDDFYYEHLDFDLQSAEARRFGEILDKLAQLFREQKRKKLIGHEVIHLVLLVDSLWDDYTRSWERALPGAFDNFRSKLSEAMVTKTDGTPSEYWLRYGAWTRTNTDRADIIQRRHDFFASEMLNFLDSTLQLKDPQRQFGMLEREVLYYRNQKRCMVCGSDMSWSEVEIHHVDGHAKGGRTILENGAPVHKHCHPKGLTQTTEFAKKFAALKKLNIAVEPKVFS